MDGVAREVDVAGLVRQTLDLSAIPTAHLHHILKLPQVADQYKAKVQAELAARGQKDRRRSKRSQDLRPTVSGMRSPDGSLVFVLRPEPPSANDIKRWLYHPRCKHHYSTYRDYLARAFAAPPVRGYTMAGAVHLTHYWRLTGTNRDEDSFGLSLKPVLDAMVAAGILEDDDRVKLELGGQECGGDGAYTDRGLTMVVRQL